MQHSYEMASSNVSEVRIVLLGEDVLQTNRVGNFILGRSAFQTEVLSSVKLHCERASGQVEGRNITIINTSYLYNPQLSQEELTQRVKECVTLADPGPHVFLLVLQSGTLTHERHDRVRNTLETYSPLSRERSIVITSGEDHGVISECEVRHHRIHDIGIFDMGQVHQLLKMIEEVMKTTGGSDLQKRKHIGRLRRYHDHLPENTAISDKDTIKKKQEENKVSELRVMLLGKSYLDTSRVGNIILGRSAFETEDPLHTGVRCQRVSRHVKGRYMTLINAPHLFHQTLSHDQLTECVKECLSLLAPGLHIIMLIVQSESFTEAEKRRMDDIFSFLSDECHKYTMVVTTKHIELGSSVDQNEGNAIEKVIAECNNRHLEFDEGCQADLVKMMEEMVKVNKRSLICKMFEDTDPTVGQKLSEQITGQLEPQQTEKCEEHMQTEMPGINLKSLTRRTIDAMKAIGRKKSTGKKHSESTQIPHMKLVLLGTEELKASISKLLLGENPSLFEKASSPLCVKQGDVCEHLLTLVEMPALCNTQQSEQEVMHLTLQCVSVCDPGVHAFLIAVPEASLTDENKAEIEIFQRIFGSRVKYHTIFIINQQSQRQQLDETLESVIKACGGQYEFYSSRTDAKQLITYVKKLLKNNNCQYTMDMYFNAQVETQLQYKKEIENLQQQITELKMSKDLFEIPETLRIVLLGKTGVGKSATGNTILGRDQFKEILSAQSVTHVCQKVPGEACGRQIAVIDTPGLFDTYIDNDEIKKEIINCISMAAPGPHVFLLVLSIGQRFTQEEREAVKIIEKTFGKKSNMYTIVLFTRGDALKGNLIEEYIKTAGENLNTLLYTCGNRYHVFNNNDKSSHTQVLTLLDKIDSMVKVNGGSCYTNEMFEEVEKALEEDKERILKEREEQIKREKEELKKKHEGEMEEMRREMQRQKERQETEKRQKEKEFEDKKDQIKREMAKKMENLTEYFRKRKEEDDLSMKKWMEEINREREENWKQWERQREEDQKQRDQAEDEERKRMEEEWKEQQKEEEEKFKKEKEEITKNKEEELKKLEHECKQRAAEEEKRRKDLEEKIKDAEESKKKELQDLQLSQQQEWERRMREEEEKRKEEQKNWEKRMTDMEEKWRLDQNRKQEQYDRERQKEQEERELKEKERKDKEEQEKKIIENDFNEKIRKMEEQLKLQREEDERERKKKDEEHRKEMEEKLHKQQEEFRKEKEEEKSKHNEEMERNLAFIRDQQNRELEKLKRETEVAARKQAEEEFTAELDKRVKEAKEATRKQAEEEFTATLYGIVKEAKEAGFKEGRETVETERTLAGRGLDRIYNSFFPQKERKKEKEMET